MFVDNKLDFDVFVLGDIYCEFTLLSRNINAT